MAASAKKSFTALLEAGSKPLNWVIARVPFNVTRAWPERRRLRVQGTIEGFAFRTSLFPVPGGQGHMLLINKKMLAGARALPGQRVRIELEPDLEERAVLIPAELARALKADRRLKPYLDSMSESMRREIGRWVADPKSAETREKRAQAMAERLLLALEGETEPPPVLEAVFARQPQARLGWLALTPTQRRNHLLGIFYYGSIEARQRRAQRAIDDALKAARRLEKPAPPGL